MIGQSRVLALCKKKKSCAAVPQRLGVQDEGQNKYLIVFLESNTDARPRFIHQLKTWNK